MHTTTPRRAMLHAALVVEWLEGRALVRRGGRPRDEARLRGRLQQRRMRALLRGEPEDAPARARRDDARRRRHGADLQQARSSEPSISVDSCEASRARSSASGWRSAPRRRRCAVEGALHHMQRHACTWLPVPAVRVHARYMHACTLHTHAVFCSFCRENWIPFASIELKLKGGL